MVVVVGMSPGVAAMGATGTATAASLSQTSTDGATIGICEQDVTLTAGPDFETTKDESIRFVADVEPDDTVEVTSYEWRVTNENDNARGNRRGGNSGQSERLLSTERSFETTLKPGQQQISLTVETAAGATLTDSISVLARGNGRGAEREIAPIADAGDCRMVIATENTTLHGTESYDRDGSIQSYEWDLNTDGSTDATGERSTVQFDELGNRTVGLTTTDDGGNTDSDTVDLFVNDRPRVSFDYSPTRPNPDESTSFDAGAASDTLGGITDYEWTIDGTVDKTGERITHAFDEPGNHTVELTVTDAYGVHNTTERTVYVNYPPTANAGDSDQRANVSESLRLSGTASTDREDGITGYEWDVDDDNAFEKSGTTVSHAFDTAGTQTVSLQVTDDGGLTDTDSVTVEINAPPEADAGQSDQRANVSESITLDGTASTDDRGIAAYEWDIDGDGSFEETGDSVTQAFETAGNRTIALRVTDSWGVSTTDTVSIEINAPPEADASNTDQAVAVDESLTLNGTASTDDRAIERYEWDVDGDGSFEQTGKTVAQTFATAGNRTVTLRVTDSWGLTSTDTATIQVLDPPSVNTTSSASTVVLGQSLVFEASESVDDDGDIVSYEWDFDGDGTTDATGSTVEVDYSSYGSYSVSLTVTDDDGISSTTTQSTTVLPNEISYSGGGGGGSSTGGGGGSVDSDGSSTTVPTSSYDWVAATVGGDPHVITFDGRSYDFQAAGEYVLARAPNGSLSVQGRFKPLADRPVSVAEAVSTSLDGHNVTIDSADSTPLVVDGQRYALGSTESLSVGNGTVYRRSDRYIVVYPGADNVVDAGDERLIAVMRSNRLDAGVLLDRDREHAVEGLFGTVAGDQPDVALANGTAISPSDYETLYGPFADDWRVDSLEQSQFHYESGESPNSFYYPDFPGEILTLDDLSEAERAAAEQAALDAGLERGTEAFENAVLDYALTGDLSYLDSALFSRPVNASFTVEAGDSFTANVSDPVSLVATIQNESAENVSVDWRFGDDERATGTEVSHTYDTTGNYTVTATATGPDGGLARDTLTVTVAENVTTEQPPIPELTTTRVNETHSQLNASGSVDPDGSVVGYAWDTDGDGSVDDRGETVTVQLQPDATTVSLVVLDDDSNRASTATDLPGLNGVPTADAGPNQATAPSGTVVFDASGSSDPDGDGLSYDWSFENGSTATGVSPTRTYESEGRYNVTLTVTDENGATDTDSSVVTVSDSDGPDAIISGNQTILDGSGTVALNASASDGIDPNYSWKLGDGTTATGSTVSHSYGDPGTYGVELTVTDAAGLTTTDTLNVVVLADARSDSFESGLSKWSINDGGFQQRGASIDGSYSAGNFEDSSSKIQARWDAYEGGEQPRKFSYYYRETRNSNGGGLRVKNSDGDIEVGFATDNPQWDIYDADGSTQIYNGDGYGQWVYVEITFDWENDEYVLYVEDQSTGTTRIHTGDLREGVDAERVEVANYAGDWGGGSSFHMNVDDVAFEAVNSDDPRPDPRATATRQRGDNYRLSDVDDAGNNRHYAWEFGDDLMQAGVDSPVHRYERPGTYTSKLSVRNEYGLVNRDTVTLRVNATDDYSESFEHGLRTWSVNDGGFRQRGASIDGSYSAGNFEDSSSKIQARDTVYPDGHQPRTFSYYYRETRDSNGGGVRVTNSDGDIEVGFATDNPQCSCNRGLASHLRAVLGRAGVA
jgi:PKD repeat protein